MQDPALPSAQDIRDDAARILDSHDFNFGTATQGSQFWEWLQRKFDALGEWFRNLYLVSPILYWLILIACFAILAAIFVHAGMVLARAYRASKGRERAPLRTRDRRTPKALLAEARAAATRGDIAAALTLYLKAAILGLDLRGLVRATETATVREYMGLLKKHPSERGLLQKFLTHYEPGVFGKRALPQGSIEECDAIARRLTGEAA